jgi:hypothetical protein
MGIGAIGCHAHPCEGGSKVFTAREQERHLIFTHADPYPHTVLARAVGIE